MSAKQPSSTGYYRGLIVGVVIAVTLMTVFNQITSSVNMKPIAVDSIAVLKEQIQSHLFATSNITSEDTTKPILPRVIVRKPMNEERTTILPKDETVDIPKVVIPSLNSLPVKPLPSPPAKIESHYNNSIVIPKSKYNPLSREECAKKYGTRNYYKESEKRLPPMLYTFPGSGNTWCRLLIEYSSGIYSGAVYNDASLLEPLPGEFKCNHLVSVVKVHPHTHDFEPLRTGHFHSDNDKCKKGDVKAFKRAILLIRNPFDSIWSEFQRRVSKSHVSGILKANFDWHRWQANACSLSHMYFKMWNEHHAGIEKHFTTDNYLYIKYEDLKNRNGLNVDAMKKVTDFLHVPATEEKLSCAFVLAENPDAHRKIDKQLMMTKEEAYTKEVTCRMWALFGHFAEKHGYKPFNNYDCRNETHPYPPIRNVNVGAQGEYDLKWVKPGQKLIDFGGYNKSAYSKNVGQLPARKGKPRPANGGPMAMKLQKQQARKERQGNKDSAGGRMKQPRGGIIASPAPVAPAETLQGLGQVGLSKPAWQ